MGSFHMNLRSFIVLHLWKAWVPKLPEDQKSMLAKMYEIRGDIVCVLGAHKRAVVDYECAVLLAPGNLRCLFIS